MLSDFYFCFDFNGPTVLAHLPPMPNTHFLSFVQWTPLLDGPLLIATVVQPQSQKTFTRSTHFVFVLLLLLLLLLLQDVSSSLILPCNSFIFNSSSTFRFTFARFSICSASSLLFNHQSHYFCVRCSFLLLLFSFCLKDLDNSAATPFAQVECFILSRISLKRIDIKCLIMPWSTSKLFVF